jgi:hypothetical protein
MRPIRIRSLVAVIACEAVLAWLWKYGAPNPLVAHALLAAVIFVLLLVFMFEASCLRGTRTMLAAVAYVALLLGIIHLGSRRHAFLERAEHYARDEKATADRFWYAMRGLGQPAGEPSLDWFYTKFAREAFAEAASSARKRREYERLASRPWLSPGPHLSAK